MTSPKPNHLPKAHLQILIPSLWEPGLQHLNLGGKTIQSTETVFHGRVQRTHHLLRPVVTLGARASTSEFEGETIQSTETVFHGRVQRRHRFPRPVGMHWCKRHAHHQGLCGGSLCSLGWRGWDRALLAESNVGDDATLQGPGGSAHCKSQDVSIILNTKVKMAAKGACLVKS